LASSRSYIFAQIGRSEPPDEEPNAEGWEAMEGTACNTKREILLSKRIRRNV
jgi:hypothetical protein